MKDSDEHVRKRYKVIGNEVEMYGKGYRQTEMESESEMTDDDRQSEGGDNQSEISEESESQSEGGDDQSDGYDSDDESEGGEDVDRDDMKGFGNIKFVDDEIYEQTVSILDLD